MARKGSSINDAQGELEDIKKLIILLLLNQGITQGQIAGVLGIDQGNLSRMVPARLVKSKKKSVKK